MPNNTHTFSLSPRGKLRWAIASLFLAPQLLFAAGITAVGGPGGTPQLHTQAGVPIVNIVAPNAGGLSHNQFMDYNVDQQGVVLNNALEAGQSRLAGQLAANPQFQGQAASVILNEVVGRNASLLNGAQEVFGRSADYVLANPNGISVNGGVLINSPNASLVVGRPEINDGKLRALNTADAQGELKVQGGLRSRDGSINLIAPRIDNQGRLEARDQLNLTVGSNRVDFASGTVQKLTPVRKFSLTNRMAVQRIDANLLGAMQAGRINIISTADGAGVKVSALQVDGREGVTISSAGDLDIRGRVRANSLNADRVGVRSLRGDVELHSAQDLSLAATDINGRNVKLDAGRNLTLSSLESSKLEEKREQWSNSNFLFTYETYDRTVRDQDTRQQGNQVVAQQDVVLTSGAATEVKASSIEARDMLRLNSGGDLRVTAATESHDTYEHGTHRKDLWNANWEKSASEQRSITSSLKAGKGLELTSQQKLQLQGAELKTPGDIQLAAQQVEITSATRTEKSSDNAYAGDLVGGSFFGAKGDGDSGKTLHTGSQVNADGKLIVKADDVRISGSRARGGKQASVISDKGSLIIDGVNETSHTNRYSNDSQFFGIAKDENRHNAADSSVVASNLRSDSNLTLQSAKDIEVSGSQVSAAGELKVDAKGDIKVASAQDTAKVTDSSHTSGFNAYAKETADGSHQYRAGVGYEDQQQTTQTETVRQQGASLSGGALVVSAGGDLSVTGSTLEATEGDASLSAKNVELVAADDSTTVDSVNTTTGGGVYYTGGMDKAGSGAQVSHQSSHDTYAGTTAQTSTVTASGNLTLHADDRLKTQGAQVEAGADLQVNASEIDNQAAHTVETSTHEGDGWTAGFAANVEYKGITRPVEKFVNDVEQSKFYQPHLVDSLDQPNVGAELEGGYTHNTSRQEDSTAQVSQFTGGTVQVDVAGTLKDEGSQYRATEGGLTIDAGSHVATAAANTHSSSEQSVNANAGLRVYTTTGEDLNIRGSGIGGSSDVSQHTSEAVLGSYAGAQGVDVNVKQDASYEGSRFQGGEAGVSLSAGGELALNQANDTRSESSTTLHGNAATTFGSTPGNSSSVNASVRLDHEHLESQDSLAQVATLDGKGPIQLSSGEDLTLQGTQIGSSTHKTGDISLSAGGQLDLQAAIDRHAMQGDELGGGLSLGGGKSSDAESSGKKGSVGGNFSIGKVAENDQDVIVAQLHSDANISLASGADGADAIHLQGTQVHADRVSLDATNGGILQESAQTTQDHNTWGVAAGAGVGGGKKTPTDTEEYGPETQYGAHGRVKVDVDNLQSTAHHNSLISASDVTLNSAGDTHLAGAKIDAERVSGTVGGDLVVESLKDHVKSAQVNVDIMLDIEKNQPGVVDKVADATGPLKDKVQSGAHGAFDKHREKLENVVDKGTDKFNAAKNSLVSNAKERPGVPTGEGTYKRKPDADAANPDNTKTHLADKNTDSADKPSRFKDSVWSKTSDSYAVNEKDTVGSKVANELEDALFGDKSGKPIYTPTVSVDVSHIAKDSVAEASGISGSQGIDLHVGGETQLTGSRLSAADGEVNLGGSTVTTTTVTGSDYRADVGLNVSKSPVNQILATKDELTDERDAATLEDQAFNVGPLRVGGHTDSQELQAGIDQRIN